MHPTVIKQEALRLVEAGINDCEISRRLGIPRRTIMDWRRPRYVAGRALPGETCPRCWRHAKPMRFTDPDYAELLGLYLGDGSISQHTRTHRLRMALDAKYPGIIEDTRRLLTRCFPRNSVDLVTTNLKGNCVNVSLYSQHLVCLFPQHGTGKKHARRIRLEPWQNDVVVRVPGAFVRGCIRSDGCAFINRTGPYKYLSYGFSNRSEDIARLFVRECERLGVVTRLNYSGHRRYWDVRINQRTSVAILLEHVGLKT